LESDLAAAHVRYAFDQAPYDHHLTDLLDLLHRALPNA
jgi:hypothetical protein